MNRTEAKNWAAKQGWTKEDADRAFRQAELKFPQDINVIATALIKFSGPELLERQRLQGSQKGQVTRKVNELIKLAARYKAQIKQCLDEHQKEREDWWGLLNTFHQRATMRGFHDPALDEYLKGGDRDAA